MLLFQFTNQHLNLYSCKEWCFDCRCPIKIPLQNCFNLIRRKSRQCFNISIEIFRHNHSDTMIFFITHFRWCVCNYLSNCNNSSSFLYLEHSHHSLRYYYISSKHRMTDAMYIILHTGCLYFDTRKKRSSAGRFFCPALHSIIYYA